MLAYSMWHVRAARGRRGARVAASSAHKGRTSDCGAAVGIVYVCAARPPTREASAACHVGLNYEHCTVCKGCGMWLRLTLQQHRPRSASRLSVTFSWEGNQPPKSDRDRQTEVVYESIVLSVFLQDKYVASRARNALPHQRPEP